jgi:mono/diheme cytochrome c family protein
MIKQKQIFTIITLFSGICLVGFSSEKNVSNHSDQEAWKAPAWADTLKSPFHEEPLTLAQGEELFTLYCATCHGETGYGDGAAGGALGQKPANFHDTLVTSQSNGALFWKLSTGKGNMPPFKDVFTEEQRWQLVAYLRQFGKVK